MHRGPLFALVRWSRAVRFQPAADTGKEPLLPRACSLALSTVPHSRKPWHLSRCQTSTGF